MGGSASSGRQFTLVEEATQVLQGRSRLLDMGVMARLWDGDQPRARHELGAGAAIGRRDDAVVLAPDEQHRDPYALQSMPELGVVHVGLPAQARESLTVPCNNR